jgi:hypothetical protein
MQHRRRAYRGNDVSAMRSEPERLRDRARGVRLCHAGTGPEPRRTGEHRRIHIHQDVASLRHEWALTTRTTNISCRSKHCKYESRAKKVLDDRLRIMGVILPPGRESGIGEIPTSLTGYRHVGDGLRPCCRWRWRSPGAALAQLQREVELDRKASSAGLDLSCSRPKRRS